MRAFHFQARANAEVKDIFKDLRDGTRLITLLEILTGKKLVTNHISVLHYIFVHTCNIIIIYLLMITMV